MERPRRKKAPRDEKQKIETDRKKKRPKVSEDTNQHLPYDVLRVIFKYLNGMDLASASIVCRSWLEAANDEKRTRGPICAVDVSNEMCLSSKSCVSPSSFRKEIIQNLVLKPSLGLFFESTLHYDEEECHGALLPQNCHVIILKNTFGVVLNSTEYEKHPNDEVSFGLTAWVFLPDIPNVRTETLVLHLPNTAQAAVEQKHFVDFTNELKEALKKPDPSDKGSKCLLIFCKEYNENFVNTFESMQRRSLDSSISIWGGIVGNILAHSSDCPKNNNKTCEQSAFCVGIVISGALQTWSIIVDYSSESEEEVQKRLMLLKNRVRLRRHSMGFMFACYVRGYRLYWERNVEATIFKKLFPEVPLVGCFGNGEFGSNTVSSHDSKEKQTFHNELSTAFMILTYD